MAIVEMDDPHQLWELVQRLSAGPIGKGGAVNQKKAMACRRAERRLGQVLLAKIEAGEIYRKVGGTLPHKRPPTLLEFLGYPGPSRTHSAVDKIVDVCLVFGRCPDDKWHAIEKKALIEGLYGRSWYTNEVRENGKNKTRRNEFNFRKSTLQAERILNEGLITIEAVAASFRQLAEEELRDEANAEVLHQLHIAIGNLRKAVPRRVIEREAI